VEWGYNRDGKNLPQINLGMVCCQKKGLPFLYHVYPDSMVSEPVESVSLKLSKELIADSSDIKNPQSLHFAQHTCVHSTSMFQSNEEILFHKSVPAVIAGHDTSSQRKSGSRDAALIFLKIIDVRIENQKKRP